MKMVIFFVFFLSVVLPISLSGRSLADVEIYECKEHVTDRALSLLGDITFDLRVEKKDSTRDRNFFEISIQNLSIQRNVHGRPAPAYADTTLKSISKIKMSLQRSSSGKVCRENFQSNDGTFILAGHMKFKKVDNDKNDNEKHSGESQPSLPTVLMSELLRPIVFDLPTDKKIGSSFRVSHGFKSPPPSYRSDVLPILYSAVGDGSKADYHITRFVSSRTFENSEGNGFVIIRGDLAVDTKDQILISRQSSKKWDYSPLPDQLNNEGNMVYHEFSLTKKEDRAKKKGRESN